MQRVNARWSCAARRVPQCRARARIGTAARLLANTFGGLSRRGSTTSSPNMAKAPTWMWSELIQVWGAQAASLWFGRVAETDFSWWTAVDPP
jgi:hypothetical protein